MAKIDFSVGPTDEARSVILSASFCFDAFIMSDLTARRFPGFDPLHFLVELILVSFWCIRIIGLLDGSISVKFDDCVDWFSLFSCSADLKLVIWFEQALINVLTEEWKWFSKVAKLNCRPPNAKSACIGVGGWKRLFALS